MKLARIVLTIGSLFLAVVAIGLGYLSLKTHNGHHAGIYPAKAMLAEMTLGLALLAAVLAAAWKDNA